MIGNDRCSQPFSVGFSVVFLRRETIRHRWRIPRPRYTKIMSQNCSILSKAPLDHPQYPWFYYESMVKLRLEVSCANIVFRKRRDGQMNLKNAPRDISRSNQGMAMGVHKFSSWSNCVYQSAGDRHHLPPARWARQVLQIFPGFAGGLHGWQS